MTKDHFAMLAAYNRWANERLYAAAGSLPAGAYREDRGAFFSSLHGTLNHLLVGDRIWMRRFTGSGPEPARLDEILFDDFEELRLARAGEDRRILEYVGSLDEASLAASLRYRTITRPAEIVQPLAPALAHFFNHQTHHRGQAHCLLTQSGNDAPSLDLILFQRDSGIGLA